MFTKEQIELIAQIIGIFAMAFNILSFQQKKHKKVIAFQLVGGFLFSINYLLLGAAVGCILNALAVVRAIVYISGEKLRSNSLFWVFFVSAVSFATYILTFTVFGTEFTLFSAVIEFLPVFAMIISTIAFRMQDAKKIRFFGLMVSPSWLTYNITKGSIGAILCEVFSLCSIIIGILRHDIKKFKKS